MRIALVLPMILSTSVLLAQQLPDGYWSLEKSRPLIERSATTRLAPDLSRLSEREKQTVDLLLQAGAKFQELYEVSRHRQALESWSALRALDQRLGSPAATQNLLTLYRLNQGPIAATLDNKREAFLPVDAPVPGRNVYPWGITKSEVDAFLAAHPAERDAILGERTVVRRATAANIDADRATLRSYPAVAHFQPELAEKLSTLASKADPSVLYAVPYSVAYAKQLTEASRLLQRAATTIEPEDAEFARYLRNRARDLVTNDYESGDAAWVTGHFQRLNAQIGAYETYDDALYGAKAFHSFNVLLLDEPATTALRSAMKGLQVLENALPYERHKRIREDIPVGIYEVIADFGQARGGNTASILPNDALFARRYGRTIMLRENIMKNPDIFATSKRGWDAVLDAPHAGDLRPEGDFQRTLWHEVGHYTGVDRDKRDRDLAIALEDYADSIEEMKADLVSLFAVPQLRASNYYDDATVRAVYAAGIRRTLQTAQPRNDQPYQRMQLLQFNYFLENGLLTFDETTKRLSVHYEKYPEVVAALLREVLSLQNEGDKAGAARFFERYSRWTPELHDVIAARMREAQGPRYRLFRYAALGE